MDFGSRAYTTCIFSAFSSAMLEGRRKKKKRIRRKQTNPGTPTPTSTKRRKPEKQGSRKTGMRSEQYLCTPIIHGDRVTRTLG
ncbi:hypothetical protein R6Z07F_005000 [Ovis aries]|uniref:Uncharacterized protein n=1 Tax=Ovis aries TaxID=9940 RepID=A0A836A8K2_SHEEP|nr:hypothetical protein JEQ12_014735 [Ovis aries]